MGIRTTDKTIPRDTITIGALADIFHLESVAVRMVLRRAKVEPVEILYSERGVVNRESYKTVEALPVLTAFRVKCPVGQRDPEIMAMVEEERRWRAEAGVPRKGPTTKQQEGALPNPLPTAQANLDAVVNTLAMIGEAMEERSMKTVEAIKGVEAAIGDLASELSKIRASFDAWNTSGK